MTHTTIWSALSDLKSQQTRLKGFLMAPGGKILQYITQCIASLSNQFGQHFKIPQIFCAKTWLNWKNIWWIRINYEKHQADNLVEMNRITISKWFADILPYLVFPTFSTFICSNWYLLGVFDSFLCVKFWKFQMMFFVVFLAVFGRGPGVPVCRYLSPLPAHLWKVFDFLYVLWYICVAGFW